VKYALVMNNYRIFATQ